MKNQLQPMLGTLYGRYCVTNTSIVSVTVLACVCCTVHGSHSSLCCESSP